MSAVTSESSQRNGLTTFTLVPGRRRVIKYFSAVSSIHHDENLMLQ